MNWMELRDWAAKDRRNMELIVREEPTLMQRMARLIQLNGPECQFVMIIWMTIAKHLEENGRITLTDPSTTEQIQG